MKVTTPSASRSAASAGPVTLAIAIDVALVLLFAGLGRSSHERVSTLPGLLETAWPFLAGVAVMWFALRTWRRPFAPLRTGIPLWAGTVAVGMLLRMLTDAGTALPFVVVAFVALGALLVGWRGIVAAVDRLRRS